MAGERVPGPVGSGGGVDGGTLARTAAGVPGVVVAAGTAAGTSVAAPDPCAKLAVDVPMSPLWHMGWAARGSQSNFDVLQSTVDYLTCKAKNQAVFSGRDKEFLKEFFEALWWGGQVKGMKEAAQLANHYVNGGGARLNIDPEVYRTSVIVADTMAAIRRFLAEEAAAKRAVTAIKSGDAALRRKPYYRALTKGGGARSQKTQGVILKGGALQAEQVNTRLKNADHRFILQAIVSNPKPDTFMIDWRVVSTYDFEPFSKASYYTELTFADGLTLRLPDGLSEYMVQLGVAKPFEYVAQWRETWQPGK